MKKVTNANKETRLVIQVYDDGMVQWLSPDGGDLQYDTKAEWAKWMRGER